MTVLAQAADPVPDPTTGIDFPWEWVAYLAAALLLGCLCSWLLWMRHRAYDEREYRKYIAGAAVTGLAAAAALIKLFHDLFEAMNAFPIGGAAGLIVVFVLAYFYLSNNQRPYR